MIALIHAFQCGSREIAAGLVAMGLPLKLALYLGCDSSVLTAKIRESLRLLAEVLRDRGQQAVADEIVALDWEGNPADIGAHLEKLFAGWDLWSSAA
jgi:hypothetical protein